MFSHVLNLLSGTWRIDIGWDTAVGEGGYAVPIEENIHHYLMNMKTKLVQIIKNRERSGQGEGTQHVDKSKENEVLIHNQDPDFLSVAQLV